MAKINAPCKDCADRKTLCHSNCEKYKAYKDENKKTKGNNRTR